jgi:hypothetical protein
MEALFFASLGVAEKVKNPPSKNPSYSALLLFYR